jgi:glucose/arabinose dehydrogenase
MINRMAVAAAAMTLAACQTMTPPAQPPMAAAAAPATAAAPAAPPPLWQQGRTADQAQSRLAPVAGRNLATPPGEIPVGSLKLPPGFKAELWASGMPGIRAMTRAENGKIYAGTRGIGRVYEITDSGTTRISRVVVDKLNQPSGVAYRNGSLYVMAVDKMLRFDGIATNPAASPVDMTAVFKLPKEQHHNWKYIAFGPDGKLYVPFGAPCNICVPPSDEYAQIRRYNADGSGMEVIARGVRNSVGFDWHPVTKELWFTDHGRDWMGDDGPEDEFNRVSATGLNFGFPYCHAKGVPDRDIKKPDPCAGVTLPVTTMGPHAAALGVLFYTGNMFPAEYRNVALVARKGSWNRTQKFGYDVVAVRAGADGSGAKVEPFMTGFLDAATQNFSGRPAYLMQMPDGAVLVSDEQLGAVYRISYGR